MEEEEDQAIPSWEGGCLGLLGEAITPYLGNLQEEGRNHSHGGGGGMGGRSVPALEQEAADRGGGGGGGSLAAILAGV